MFFIVDEKEKCLGTCFFPYREEQMTSVLALYTNQKGPPQTTLLNTH